MSLSGYRVSGSLARLAPPTACDHKPGSGRYYDCADGRRNLLVFVSLNANIDVTRLDAMVFGMRDSNEKREDPQDQYRQPDYK
jgi:hypothetical protein